MTPYLVRLAIYVGFVALVGLVVWRSLPPLLPVLRRGRVYPVVFLVLAATLAQAFQLTRSAYPVGYWGMYAASPGIDRAWDLMMDRGSGWERFPFGALVPFSIMQPFPYAILREGGRIDWTLDPEARQEDVVRLEAELRALAEILERRRPGLRVRRLALRECPFPFGDARTRDEVACNSLLVMELEPQDRETGPLEPVNGSP